MDTPAKQAAHDDGSQSPVPVTMRMGSGSPTMSPPSRAPGSNIEDPGLAPQGAGEFNGTAPEGRDRDVGNGPQLGFGPATGRGKVPAIKSADVYRHGSVSPLLSLGRIDLDPGCYQHTFWARGRARTGSVPSLLVAS